LDLLLTGLCMSNVRNAALAEAVNQGLIHNNRGILIDLANHRKFSTSDFENAVRMHRFGSSIPFSLCDHIALGFKLLHGASVKQKQFWLLHEQFECLSGLDIQYPIKHTWPWYVENEERYLEIVYEKHGLDFSKYTEMVKEIDRECAILEARHFFYKEYNHFVFKCQGTRKTYLLNRYLELFPAEVRANASR